VQTGDLTIPCNREVGLRHATQSAGLAPAIEDKQAQKPLLVAESKERLAGSLRSEQLLELPGRGRVGSQRIGTAWLGGTSRTLGSNAEPLYGLVW
jgi:hypothetical protein